MGFTSQMFLEKKPNYRWAHRKMGVLARPNNHSSRPENNQACNHNQPRNKCSRATPARTSLSLQTKI